MFDNYLDQMDSMTSNFQFEPVSFTKPRSCFIAKDPPYLQRPLSTIKEKHDAPNFSRHLKEFLNSFLENPTTNRNTHYYQLPFDHLDVWTQFKFQPNNLSDDSDSEETDTVKAIPKNSPHEPNGQFDPVVVLRSDEAESTGMEGMIYIFNSILFY